MWDFWAGLGIGTVIGIIATFCYSIAYTLYDEHKNGPHDGG